MARPAKFKNEDILEATMELFWENGYRGVSISDIVKATGVLAGSIYGRFGSKEGVFIECIHHYAKQTEGFWGEAEKAATPLGKIEALFNGIVENSLKPCDRKGCFVMNAMLELSHQNEQIAAITQSYVQQSEGWIKAQIEEAKRTHELKEDTNSDQLALSLYGIIYGIRGMSKAIDTEERIRAYHKNVLTALLDPHKTQPLRGQ
ncbi:TetR/AcrR family transcriptional regulator [Puniceicoccaceae bacterium K14]|nr:TetR/AcrR family transcriptional regulator [Puniceicoccaceae bacterium K14]